MTAPTVLSAQQDLRRTNERFEASLEHLEVALEQKTDSVASTVAKVQRMVSAPKRLYQEARTKVTAHVSDNRQLYAAFAAFAALGFSYYFLRGRRPRRAEISFLQPTI